MLSPRRPTAIACIAALFLTAATRAHAQPGGPVSLRWTAPPSCPSREDVERNVVRTIGDREVSREPLQARVDVWQSEAGGWKADIELSAAGETTQRQVRGATCEAVADAVAVVITVAAVHDPLSAGTSNAAPPGNLQPPAAPAPTDLGPAPVASPLPVAPGRPVPASIRAPRPAESPARRRPAHLLVGSSALLDVGSLPAVAPGVELFAGWRPSWWRLEAVGTYLASERAVLGTDTAQGATLWQAALGGRACASWRRASVEIGPCAAADATWAFASGFGADSPKKPTAHGGDAQLAAHATLSIAAWASLHLGAGVVLPFVRPTFAIDNAGDVYHPSAIAFRGSAGLEVRF